MAYFASGGHVYVQDGPWEARLTERQCDALLAIWDAADAVTLFNDLHAACEAAGHIPGLSRRPALRLVVQEPARRGIVRDMLARSLGRDPDPTPPQAA